MKQRILFTTFIVLLFLTSCYRKDDFSDLKSDITIQGDFDPRLGIPLAYYDADMWDLAGLFAFDTSDNLHVRLDSNAESGLLTLYAQYTNTLPPIIFGNSKAAGRKTAPKAQGDTAILFQTTLHHENPIKLGSYLIDNDMTLHNLYVSFTASLKATISETTQRLLDHGVIVYFDTVLMKVYCHSGDTLTRYVDLGEKVSIQDLIQGRTLNLVNDEDISQLINLNAYHASFSTVLNIAATENTDMVGLGPSFLSDTLLVKRLDISCDAYVQYSAVLYVGNLREVDTIEADCSGLSEYIDDGYSDDNFQVSLGDSSNSSYIVIKADNGLPCNVTLQLRGLDGNYMPVTDGLIAGDHIIRSPDVERVPAEIAYTTSTHDAAHQYVGYRSKGSVQSELRVPVSPTTLRKLAKSKYIEISIIVKSTTAGTDPSISRPFVIVRNVDQLKLKLFVIAGAHLGLNYPLTKTKQ